MQYVSVGPRAVAAIIDGIPFFIGSYVIALVTGNTTGSGFELNGTPALLAFLLWWAYMIVTEATLGASVGKLVLGLRVVKLDGSKLDWGAAIIRNVLRLVDGIVFYILGAILIWTSPTRQRLGDRVAGTVVVRRQNVPVAQT